MYHPLALFLQEGQFPENPTRFIPRGSENLRCSLPLAPPTIKGPSETSEVSVVLGFSTQLPCDVEGSPTPSITWLKDNQPIVSGPRLTYTRGGQALRLGAAQGDSTGLYTCRATNPAGTAVKHYSLSVLGKMPPNHLKHNLRMFNYVFFFLLSPVPPQIEGDSPVFGIQEEKVRMNGSLTLSCMTKGFPEPKIQWFKDGQVGETPARPFKVI